MVSWRRRAGGEPERSIRRKRSRRPGGREGHVRAYVELRTTESEREVAAPASFGMGRKLGLWRIRRVYIYLIGVSDL
jgi:hypothetical protein